tara:strand:- start:437 stop:775 length:339 start_codon:yes stop_codon:yes gene_type:complete
MAMSKYRWIYTTWPDAGLAGAAGRTLVQEGLCACVNILPGMTSVYRWQGAVETANEAVMILKTSSEKAPAVIDRLVALHPYDEPCAVGLDIDAAASAPGFLTWMGAALSAGA